ncbi:sulfatase family protein [Hyphomonas neptunium ATCC 15444]|uniref:Sulfatase family protein n=3 Tax=Hyphomonadaceae TaxID=69657 RepID=Q0C036_HYPNA|nr:MULTISPECIES: arylsulfatase [Hyphomonas]ABI76343.1 sulfatase family protein [Hyphomonas neptunium ATCC 15444]KCZ90510.1 sulfatase family protein [Hyphomonas hirschiana VP5]
MRCFLATLLTCMSVGLTAGCASSDPPSQPERPNFLVIVADDMGWSDLGAFGGEIDTPNLDQLAMGGIRLTDFHTSPTCSPTRAMLLTGADHHRVGLGTMPDLITPAQRGQPGYEGYLTSGLPTVAETLSAEGYFTAITGKWHLGNEASQLPVSRGFDRSYVLLNGSHNQFGADQNEHWKALGEQADYREGLEEVQYPLGIYSSDFFAGKLISYLEESSQNRPFFAYIAYTQPHWPLQAPADTIAKYKGRYDAGPEALRAERLARQKALGLVAEDVEPHPFFGVKPWESLSAEQRAMDARRMEIYAAMIDEMDQSVGRILTALRESGELDNTVIVFLSDNGPHARPEEAPRPNEPGATSNPDLIAALNIDNSLASLGSAQSYTGYGPGWAQAGSAPSRLFKGVTTQGGIRTTAFVNGPGIPGGQISDALLHVMDITPTLLDLASIHTPDNPAIEGRSWAELLSGAADHVRAPEETLGWELFYGRAVRQGDWKAVYLAARMIGATESRWELFNLEVDPGETQDLSATEPERLKTLLTEWDRYAARNGVVVPPPAPDGAD